jgi:hypothetical protein
MTLDYALEDWRDKRRFPARKAREALLVLDPRCAECGIDLVELEERKRVALEACERARWFAILKGHRGPWEVEHLHKQSPRNLVHAALLAMGFKKPKGSLVEVDHIRPLWAGGVDSIENMEARCQPCHAKISRHQSKVRAAAKRRAKRRGIA